MEKGGGNRKDGSGFNLSLILASNLGAAKSIALCEATELGKSILGSAFEHNLIDLCYINMIFYFSPTHVFTYQ